jgi:hypothetical protein
MGTKYVYCFECTDAANNGGDSVFFCDESIYHRVTDDEPETEVKP